MTITHVKAMIGKAATLALCGAAVCLAAPKANAQVSFGVRLGGPVAVYGHVRPYYAPAPVYGYYRPDYGYDRRLEWERHEAFLRHEERERFEHERFEHERFARDGRFYGR